MSKQEDYMADLNRREQELHDRAKEIRERLDGIRETVERRENELAAEVKTTLPKEAYDYAADLKRREEELHERAKEAAARLEVGAQCLRELGVMPQVEDMCRIIADEIRAMPVRRKVF